LILYVPRQDFLILGRSPVYYDYHDKIRALKHCDLHTGSARMTDYPEAILSLMVVKGGQQKDMSKGSQWKS
jgi:hypothetical protein